MNGIDSIARHHYTEVEGDDRLYCDILNFDYTDANPAAPESGKIGVAQSIVIRHIAMGVYNAEEQGELLNIADVYGPIVTDLRTVLNVQDVRVLVEMWPGSQGFETAADRIEYERVVLATLLRYGYTHGR